jgi:hypothetical protein
MRRRVASALVVRSPLKLNSRSGGAFWGCEVSESFVSGPVTGVSAQGRWVDQLRVGFALEARASRICHYTGQ